MTMIVKAAVIVIFVSLVTGVLMAMLRISPVLPAQIAVAIQFLIDGGFWANRFLPIDTALLIFGAELFIDFSVWIFKNSRSIINWGVKILS